MKNRLSTSGAETDVLVASVDDIYNFNNDARRKPELVYLKNGGSYARRIYAGETEDEFNIKAGDYLYKRRTEICANQLAISDYYRVDLNADSPITVLTVVIENLYPNSFYTAVLKARFEAHAKFYPETCGFVDIEAIPSIATDSSGVATCTIDPSNIYVTSKLVPAIETTTGTITASAGGFIVTATRTYEEPMRVQQCEAQIFSLVWVG